MSAKARREWSFGRQMSFESPAPAARPTLKKQASAEGTAILWGQARPRAVRVAWEKDKEPETVEVVATKCLGQQRPPMRPPLRSPVINEKTVAQSRKDISERLRRAWRKSRSSKLDIFLDHHNRNFQEPCTPEPQLQRSISVQELPPDEPLLENTPRKNNLIIEVNDNVKQVVNSSQEKRSDSEISIENDLGCSSSEETFMGKEEVVEVKCLTASERRMNFKNGKKMFGTAVSESPPGTPSEPRRKPLERMMSAPARPKSEGRNTLKKSESIESPILKQAKPAPPKRKLKSAKRRLGRPRDDSSGDERDTRKQKGRGRQRDKGELVTMVSLVSPSTSDVETEEVAPPVIPPTPVPLKNEDSPTKTPTPHPPPLIQIRRPPPKEVTFKPPLGDVGGSNFPLRRPPQSILQYTAPPILLNRKKPLRPRFSQQSSRSSEDELTKPHESESDDRPLANGSPSSSIKGDTNSEFTEENKENASEKRPLNIRDDQTETETEAHPDLSTPKEKECWNVFRHMTDKGVTVSFETVLRGMLTPTEYRLRRTAMIANCWRRQSASGGHNDQMSRPATACVQSTSQFT